MTTIEAAQYAYLVADADLAALVGTRLYPLLIPQEAALPAVAYQRISGPRILAHDGPTGAAEARIQYTITGASYSSAKAVAAAIRRAVDGYAGQMADVTVEVAHVLNELDSFEFDILGYPVRLDVRFLYREY